MNHLYSPRLWGVPKSIFLLLLLLIFHTPCTLTSAEQSDTFLRRLTSHQLGTDVKVTSAAIPTSTLAELQDGPNVCQRSEKQYVPSYTMKLRTRVEQVKPKCDLIDKLLSIVTKKCEAKPESVERWENVTEYEERFVVKRFCCDGYLRFIGKCIPHCPDHCIHGECVAPNVCRCNSGFSGKRCLYSCKPLTWGLDCSHKCSCKHTDTCDPENGDCDCPAGWTGSDCSVPCPDGYYGHNCTLPCTCIASANTCDRFTGSCHSVGFVCRSDCERGARTLGCNETADACACAPGYGGRTCDAICPVGTYGPSCSLDCSHCHTLLAAGTGGAEGRCHHVTGDCECPPGRTGRLCQSDCLPGTYGPQCSKVCDCQDLVLPEDDHYYVRGGGPEGGDLPTEVTYQNDYSSTNSKTIITSTKDSEGRFLLGAGDNTCHPVTGKCVCGTGYSGPRCENRMCPPWTSMQSTATFGNLSQVHPPRTPPCSNICNSTCDNSSGRVRDCHPFTSTCQCSSGWRRGPDCSVPCPLVTLSSIPQKSADDPSRGRKNDLTPLGYALVRTRYGDNCGRRCACSREGLEKIGTLTLTEMREPVILECHPETGACICPPGTFGETCEKVCPGGTYGMGCQHTCQCKNGNTSACNPVTGSCTNCLPGFHGIRCDSPCQVGFWGDDCGGKCPLCRNGGSCDKTSGKCQCPPGFTGHSCESPCQAGTYGHGCVHRCARPSPCPSRYFYHNASCNAIHGGCSCGPGYHLAQQHLGTNISSPYDYDQSVVTMATLSSVCVKDCHTCPAGHRCHPVKGCAPFDGKRFANLLGSLPQTNHASRSRNRSTFLTILLPLFLTLFIAVVAVVLLFRRNKLLRKRAMYLFSQQKAGANGKWHELRMRRDVPNGPGHGLYGEELDSHDGNNPYPNDPHDMRPIHGLPRRPLNPPKQEIAFSAINTTPLTSSPGSREGNFDNPAYDEPNYVTIDSVAPKGTTPTTSAYHQNNNANSANNKVVGKTGGAAPDPKDPKRGGVVRNLLSTAKSQPPSSAIKGSTNMDPPGTGGGKKLNNIEVANKMRERMGSENDAALTTAFAKGHHTNTGRGSSVDRNLYNGFGAPPPTLAEGNFDRAGPSDDPFYLAFLSKKDQQRHLNPKAASVSHPKPEVSEDSEIDRKKKEASLQNFNSITSDDFLRSTNSHN